MCRATQGDASSSVGDLVSSGREAESFIQGFPMEGLDLSHKGQCPFHFRIGGNSIDDNSCQGIVGGGWSRDFMEPTLPFHISRDVEQ